MILKDVHSSLLAFCAQLSQLFPNTEVVYLDAHADDSNLPQGDFISLSGVSVSVDSKIVEVRALIGASTFDDTNLFRLRDMTAEIFERLLPEKKLPLFDAQTGAEKGWLIAQDGTSLLTVSGSVARPLQHILVHLNSSLTC